MAELQTATTPTDAGGRQLILASSSPARRELLARLGLAFRSVAPSVDERAMSGESSPALARRLAGAKADAVAAGLDAPALVIGSDQVASLDEGARLGKPGGFEQARAQLREASGGRMTFQTALCLLDSASGRRQQAVDITRVWFRPLDDATIERYLRREQPYGCAGSFKAEGLGIALFERVESTDPSGLIGLPLIRLCRMLAAEGVRVP